MSEAPEKIYPLAYFYYQRLLKWADFLEELPAEQFNLQYWRKDCGTVACAAGWLPTIFPRHWKVDTGDAPPNLLGARRSGLEACLFEFFQVPRVLSRAIIYAHYYESGRPRKATVVKRIRKIAEDLRVHGGCCPSKLPAWRRNKFAVEDHDVIYIGPKGSPRGLWDASAFGN